MTDDESIGDARYAYSVGHGVGQHDTTQTRHDAWRISAHWILERGAYKVLIPPD